MPIDHSLGETPATSVPSSRSTAMAIVSFNKYDQAGTFNFELEIPQQVPVEASYFEGETLKDVKFPPPGSTGSITGLAALTNDNLSNACFKVQTDGVGARHWQPFRLPSNLTYRSLKSSWAGTVSYPDGKWERLFAAGFMSGSTSATQKEGRPDWVVLGVKQNSLKARTLLKGDPFQDD